MKHHVVTLLHHGP